ECKDGIRDARTAVRPRRPGGLGAPGRPEPTPRVRSAVNGTCGPTGRPTMRPCTPTRPRTAERDPESHIHNVQESDDMAFSVQMPELGESVTEGTVTRWLKQVG